MAKWRYPCGHTSERISPGPGCPLCGPVNAKPIAAQPRPWTQAELCALVGAALQHFIRACPRCEGAIYPGDMVDDGEVAEFVGSIMAVHDGGPARG